MVLTPSTMLTLGTQAPDFSLWDVTTEKSLTLGEAMGEKGLLVMFICCHCPFVKHIQAQLSQLGKDYQNSGLAMVAISANDAAKYPDDAPPGLKKMAQDWDYRFPVLYDETQAIAKAYRAACTPDFFLFDAQGKLAYRGQLDDSRPSNGLPVTGVDLRQAMDLVLAGSPVPTEQKPSIGCNIKWKPGNEPDYQSN
ncbi:thioredoxin family protein [Synechocystis salina]|uniref:Thioredoxin family protein n=1 Tax=Synechocystis salina LEGE 00031 TaxID=1828736 RepID=A0ABR9VQX9_9SYNC|nr:thioredoxin family protein [Synechocystis salina]MBE9239627.1 thioredoxin family protein [Synechocystis salina LEGE 00041]MBE9252666.1 thioredoxin family protein [Synechocystis salina LEGE 00031]